MKTTLLFTFLSVLGVSLFSQYTDNDNQQLWLLTAKVSVTKTYQSDTSSTFFGGGHSFGKESHRSAQTSASGQIIAVVENQAENPDREFVYTTDAGEPVSFSVTGKGTYNESSNYRETINGTLVSEDNRTDNVSGSARPEASVHFQYSDEYKSASVSMDIKAVGSYSGKMFDGDWKDYGGDYDDYNIWCSGGCDQGSDRNCNIIKTAAGYSASWKSSESKRYSTGSGPEYITEEHTLEISIVPYKPSEKPVLTLNGCASTGVGEQGIVTATAKPEGGSYKFWVEPGDILSVTSDGSATATITGLMPGEGVLMAEYTTIDGKTAQTSLEASCVNIESYNQGNAIQQIAFYDLSGKKTEGILTIPVTGQPENVAELVKFEPANPGLLSAVGLGSDVTLQGIATGKTTLQAKTKCGTNTGPAIEVEVVNCDDETIARLEKMEQAAAENLKIAINEVLRSTNSPESVKARNDFLISFNLMMGKIGLTILANGKAPTKFAGQAFEIADKGGALLDIIGSSNSEEIRTNIDKVTAGETFERGVKSIFGETISDLYGKSLSGAIALYEVYDATEKFADNAVKLGLNEESIGELMRKMEKVSFEYDVIKARQQLCRMEKSKNENEEIELADLKPIPQEQAPKLGQTPKSEPTAVEQPQSDQPVDEPSTNDDEIIVDPEPPVIPPKQVGLPYEPSDCGCNKTKNLTVSSTDFSTLAAGIQNLGECVKDFSTTTLKDYQQALQEMSELTKTLSSTLESDAEAFLIQAKQLQPQLDSIVKRIRAYDEAGNAFLNQMQNCSESVTTGMEIFQSVEKITIDSIQTNY